MALSDEQAKAIKEQLLSQISKLPEDQQKTISEQIKSMNNEQLEQFLIQNKMIQQQGESPEGQPTTPSKAGGECVFCSIVNRKIPPVTVYEDEKYLGALEINPFSEGHTIVIPKKHIKTTNSLPTKAYSIAKRIGKHLVKKLKAESFEVNASANLGHAIINIIPTYKDQQLKYKRKQKKPEELQKLAIKIGEITKRTRKKSAKKALPKMTNKDIKSALIKLPRRIP
jgi:histidine triad (HIT) family protein